MTHPRHPRWTSVAFLVLTATAGALDAASVNKGNPYSVTLDLSGDATDKFQQLDENEVVARCRDLDGCTVWVKIDGPAGIRLDIERLYLSAYSLSYTTSGRVGTSPPLVDADKISQVVGRAHLQTAKGFAQCDFADIDAPATGDVSEGFSLRGVTTAANLGATVCLVSIVD